MTTPVQDPNPPATQPDTTVNGGSDFSGQPGRPYVSPDSIVTSQNVSNKDTEGITGRYGTDGNLNGPDSSRTVNAPQTSGTDGTTASGAVVNTGATSTVDTGQYGPPGAASTAPYRPPAGDVPVTIYDSTKTDRRTDVPDDNNPNSVPSGYAVNLRDTTGVGTRQGGPVTFTPPGAPTGVTATPVVGRREIEVSWTPGSAPVGAPVKRWLVQGNTTGSKIVPADEHQTVMSEGLVAGQEYTFTVYAETDLGTGYRSAPSAPVAVSNANMISDVNYVEDDREPRYVPAGTDTPATPET